jgi:polyisoprenoid-binding protein YceI
MSDSTTGDWALDPSASHADFSCKTFWGLMTVRGTFGGVTGNGTVAEDGTITGELSIDAASLNTKNKQRDKHLRSADFFNVDKHPSVVVTVTSAQRDGSELACQGTVEAAGSTQPATFTAHVDSADADAAVLRGEITLDRRQLGMSWNQLGMVGNAATGTLTARFARS